MRKKIYIGVLVLAALGFSSCNDWLDVRPETEQKEDDQFSSYQGFCDAVTGMYMTMADRDIYGERLTMTNIESLANLWSLGATSTRYEDYNLELHDYDNVVYSQAAIKAIYAKLFNTIVQANLIIKHVGTQGGVINNPATRAAILGEAYGIRAYCHLDLLRLFGQVPGGTTQVSLPYSETTGIDEMPRYYNFEEYVGKLESDILMAESLLKDNDPVFQYSFSELNSYPDGVDEFMYYRQSRMNYWAVKALEARMRLYVGDKSGAREAAGEVINATLNGSPVMTMSGVSDFANGYKLCPNECLFYLSKYDVMDYSQSFLVGDQQAEMGDAQNAYSTSSSLGITEAQWNELFSGCNPNSNNRMLYCWAAARDEFGQYMYVTDKYYWNPNVSNQMLCFQLIPMLRMSEMYLIVMETTTDLNEANTLYRDYMLAHGEASATPFASLEERDAFILNEYRREFFAEGQMFYTYKRLNSSTMMWREEPVSESEYVLPLPTTEYNPDL